MIILDTMRRRFFLGLVLAMLAFLTIGAVRVQSQWRLQEQAAAQACNRASLWHRQIADELPVHQRNSWRELGEQDPLTLLEACTTTVHVKP